MKKNLLAMVLGMVIMSCVGFIGFTMINKNHEAELEELKAVYEDQLDDLEAEYNNVEAEYIELRDSKAELEEQVYSMMEGESYEFEIKRDGQVHTYKKTGKGLFSDVSHTVWY